MGGLPWRLGPRWPGTVARASRRRAGGDRAPGGGEGAGGPRTARAVPGSRGADGVNGLNGLVHRAAVGRQWCIVVTRSRDPRASAASAGRPAELCARPCEPTGRGAM